MQETNCCLAQFYRVWSHLSGCWIADGWANSSRSLGHGDWSVRNVNNIQHNHTGHKETCAVCDSKTKTQVKWITYESTHILLKESLSCTFWRHWSCDQNDNQKTKSHNETCVKNCSTSWISRWMVVATSKVFFLKPESALWLVPCLNEDRKQPRTMAHRQQKEHLWILVMHSQYKEDVSSQRSGSLVNPGNDDERKRVGPPSGNWGHSSSNAEAGNSPNELTRDVYFSPQESWAERPILSKNWGKLSLAQGNLMHHYQNWWTWDSQIIDTRERYSNVNRRNWGGGEGLHSILRYWYG